MALLPRRLRAALTGTGLAALLVAGLSVPTAPAFAADLDDQRAQNEARQQATEDAMESLGHELEHTDAALVEAYAALEGLNAQIAVAQSELAAAEERLAQLEREAAIIAERLVAAEAEEASITAQVEADAERADDLRGAIGEMAREAYKGDMTASSLTAVLDATSTEDFIEQSALTSTALRTQTQALRDLEQINGLNRNRQARLEAVREEITALKAEADAKVVEAEAARAEARARTEQLDALLVEQEAKTAELEALKAEQLAKEAELAAQQAALEAELATIIAAQEEERRRQEAAGNSGGGGGAVTGNRPFSNPTSFTPWVRTSKYGMRFHPIDKVWRLHAGMDLRAYCGTPLYAGASGTVQWARFRGGYGGQVMINHGYWNGASLMSSYNHMSSFSVGAGQYVNRGDLIGYAGNTGTSAACHLHFEVYVNGATVDPEPMLN